MKMNLVSDIELVVNKGDAFVVEGRIPGTKQLIICCPQCGQTSGSAGNHIYDEATQSYTPSIVHDVALGGCGWHGWLTYGVFSPC